LSTNKAKESWGFNVVLKSNMSQTCFGVWDMIKRRIEIKNVSSTDIRIIRKAISYRTGLDKRTNIVVVRNPVYG